MICKIATITHTKNSLDYCEKGGELIHANGVSGNSKEINKQFKEVQTLKENIKHKSLHAIISFNPEDRELNKGELMEISEKYAEKHGFDKNQYAVYLHQDKAHKHLHIVANRIGYDRKVVSSSHSYAKNTEFSKSMEIEYELIKTNRKEKGKDFKPQKEFAQTMKIMIDNCLKNSKSMNELSNNLKDQYCVTMYKGRGVSFMYQEKNEKARSVKGSEVGRAYSLKGLEKQIENIHFPKKFEASDRLKKLANDLNKEVADMKKPNTTPTKDTGLSASNNISSALGNENFEDDEPIKRKKKRNKGFDSGMTP